MSGRGRSGGVALTAAAAAALGKSPVALAASLTWNPAGCTSLGDSYWENGYAFSASGFTQNTNGRGVDVALNMVLGAPWRAIYPRCKSGTRTDQWIASAPGTMTNGGLVQALTDDSLHVLVTFPTNDIIQSVPASTIIPYLKTIADALLSVGKLPWLTVGGICSNFDATKLAQAAIVNAWTVAYCRANGLPWIDLKTPLVDPTSGVLTALNAYDEGGSVFVHPSHLGTVKAMLAQKRRLLPYVQSALISEPWRVSKALNSFLGSHTSGLPASWITFSSTVGSPTRTAPADSRGGWQTSFTAGGANAYDGLQQAITLAASGFAVGQIVQAIIYGQIVSATGGVTPRIYLNYTGSSADYTFSRANARLGTDTNQLWSQSADDNVFALATAPIAVPAGTTGFNFGFTFEADNGVAVVARVDRVEFVSRP